jgi:predicted metal-binding protein
VCYSVVNRLFAFVAKTSANVTDNLGHVFAELSADQPAPAIVNFMQKLLMEHQGRFSIKS